MCVCVCVYVYIHTHIFFYKITRNRIIYKPGGGVESLLQCNFIIIYLFLERQGGREIERNTSIGNRTSDLLVRRPVLDPLSRTSQGTSSSFHPSMNT